MEDFAKEVIRRLTEHFGDMAEISYQKVTKRNDICHSAVMVCRKEATIGKIIYLDFYLEAYEQGVSMEEIMEKVLNEERTDEIVGEADAEVFSKTFWQYDSIKSNMIISLCNRERNQKYLKGKTYMEMLDLAVVFYVAALESESGIGTVAIPEEIIQQWKVSKEQMLSDVFTYSAGTYPERYEAKVVNISQCIEEALGLDDDFSRYMNPPEAMSEEFMYVLSSRNGFQGAVVMFYPDVMKEIAEKLGWKEILIFPSSIHEVILVDAGRWKEKYFDELKDHVRYVNEHCVSETEFLSNNIYRYRLEDDRIEIADGRKEQMKQEETEASVKTAKRKERKEEHADGKAGQKTEGGGKTRQRADGYGKA